MSVVMAGTTAAMLPVSCLDPNRHRAGQVQEYYREEELELYVMHTVPALLLDYLIFEIINAFVIQATLS